MLQILKRIIVAGFLHCKILCFLPPSFKNFYEKLFDCTDFILQLIAFAQQKPTDLDKSPLDVSYSPSNFPILKMNGKQTEGPFARVLYSRPQKAGRTIFGGIVNYEQVWRLGANEATEIEFFKMPGLPEKYLERPLQHVCNLPRKTWTIVLNNEKDVWGLFYNAKKMYSEQMFRCS